MVAAAGFDDATDDIIWLENDDISMSLASVVTTSELQSKKIRDDQELIQSDPTSCPQNQKGNN